MNRWTRRSAGWKTGLVCGGIFAGVAATAPAASLVWNGGVAGTWQDGAGGWLNGITPANWNNVAPDAAVFTGTTPLTIAVDAGGINASGISVAGASYTLNGPGVLDVAGSIDVADGQSLIVNGSLASTGGFTKEGDGTLILTNSGKIFAGPTVINAGAIQVYAMGGGFFGATATQQVELAGGRLQAQFAANTTPSNTIVVTAAGGEVRNLGNDSQRWIINGSRFTGNGTLTLSFGASNSRYQFVTGQNAFTGKWIINSGGNQNRYADLFSSTSFGGATGADAITLENSGSLALRNAVTLGSTTQGITLGTGVARIIAAGGSTAVVAAAISGPTSNAIQFATENATSLLIISNTANSWLGETTINGPGLVRLGLDETLPDAGRNVVVNGGATLDLFDADETIPGLFGGGVVDNRGVGASVLTVGLNNENPTFSGSLRNTGTGATLGLVKVGTGTQTLNGTNTYSGLTRVEDGILLLSIQGSIADSFRIDVLDGATLSANTRTDGTFTLGAARLLTGAGTVRGNVTNNGAIRTGLDNVGTLVVSGQYAQAASASLRVTVASGVPTALRVTGPAALNGTLEVLIDGTEPVSGTIVTALTTSARSGTFAVTNLAPLAGGLGWDVAYTATSVLLSVTGAAPVTGFAAWAAGITNGLTNLTDSATGDGYQNLLKYATGSSPTTPDLLAHMNASIASGTLSLVFNRNTNATDVVLVVQGSDSVANNATWVGIATNTAGVWNPPVAVETGSGNPVSVRVPDSVSSGTNRFLRLNVILP